MSPLSPQQMHVVIVVEKLYDKMLVELVVYILSAVSDMFSDRGSDSEYSVIRRET